MNKTIKILTGVAILGLATFTFFKANAPKTLETPPVAAPVVQAPPPVVIEAPAVAEAPPAEVAPPVEAAPAPVVIEQPKRKVTRVKKVQVDPFAHVKETLEKIAETKPKGIMVKFVTALGNQSNPAVKNTTLYILGSAVPAQISKEDLEEAMNYVQNEMGKDPQALRASLVPALRTFWKKSDFKMYKTTFMNLIGNLPPSDDAIMQDLALIEVQEYGEVERTPASVSTSTDGKTTLDPTPRIQNISIQAFLASSGNDPQVTLMKLRPILDASTPSARVIYESAFIKRYPGFTGTF